MAGQVVILRQGSTVQLTKDLTVSGDYQNLGAPIDVRTSTRIGLYLSVTINDSTGLTIQGKGKTEPDGNEYEVDGIGTVVLADIDNKKYLEFDSGTLPYVQFKVKASVVGASPAVVTVNVDQKVR